MSTSLRPALVGAATELEVVAAFPRAVYLAPSSRDALAGGPPIVSLIRPGAVVAPNSVVVTMDQPPRWPTGRGDASIGDGRLVVGELAVQVSRWWSPTPRAVSPDPGTVAERAAELRAGLRHSWPLELFEPDRDPEVDAREWSAEAQAWGSVGGSLELVLVRRLDAVVRALRRGDVPTAERAAQRLIGLGPGLTPAGDDLLCGLVVAARWLSHRGGDRVLIDAFGRRVLDGARGSTTAVSYASLWHAVRGEVAGPTRRMLRALAGHGVVAELLPELLAVGSTSGRDLALGLLAGALVASERSAERQSTDQGAARDDGGGAGDRALAGEDDGPLVHLPRTDEPAIAGGGGRRG